MAHVIPNFGNGCDDSDPEDRKDNDVICEHCGARGLSWLHTGVRWRLVDNIGVHVCKPSADDFDVVDT